MTSANLGNLGNHSFYGSRNASILSTFTTMELAGGILRQADVVLDPHEGDDGEPDEVDSLPVELDRLPPQDSCAAGIVQTCHHRGE